MSYCPRCRHSFRTLPDEVGDHGCPMCGRPEETEEEMDERIGAAERR